MLNYVEIDCIFSFAHISRKNPSVAHYWCKIIAKNECKSGHAEHIIVH